jgi:hypothetical protein
MSVDRLPPDPRPAPAAFAGGLGAEIRRWLSQADDRLGELDPIPPAMPRADDFGHVTAPAPSTAALPSRATPNAGESRLTRVVRVTLPSERHGIFVASGWGTRALAG